jgi:flagellar hook-associated protein 3 FlgL
MRVTNDTLRNAFLSALESAQQRLLQTQAQVTTGRRINAPSEDPLAAARIGELGAAVAQLEQYRTNGATARSRLALGEEALASVINNLQRVRELAVQANNATMSNGDRLAIAAELRERLEGVVAVANSTDASGKYLFAGFSETTLPFVHTGGTVAYNGDEGRRSLQIGAERSVAVNDSGSAVFENVSNGNGTFTLAAGTANVGTGVLGAGSVVAAGAYVRDGYTITFVTTSDYEVRDSGGTLVTTGTYAPGQAVTFPGVSIELTGEPAVGDTFDVAPSGRQSVFTTLANLINVLETPVTDAASRALSNNQVGQLLLDIDQGVNHVIERRADIGSRQRAIDDELAMNEGFSVQLAETLSEIRDLDYAEALSRLTQQLFGLEAAQQTYARTQGLSLFRYL